MDWVPAYLDLWVDDKADLSHATRSIYLRLCLAARRACREGLIPLPPSARSDQHGVHSIVGGRTSEISTAIAEMTCHQMIAFEVIDEQRFARIVAWADWSLRGRVEDGSAGAAREVSNDRSPAAVRAARYRANRKARDAAGVTDHDGERDGRHAPSRDASHGPSRDGSVTHGGGKGGASPPDQKRVEERTVVETRGEERSDARARGPAEGSGSESDGGLGGGEPGSEAVIAPVVTTESLLAAVGRHPMLATLYGDRQWAMRAVGGMQAAACRAEDAAAAVDAFVTKRAAKAPPDGPALDAFVREHIGGFLRDAKRHGDEARARRRAAAPASSSSAAAVRTALEVFGEVWAARKREPFVRAEGDEKHAASLVELAREHATEDAPGREIVRHWAERYVRDEERLLVDANHPLRLLPRRVSQYGLPERKRKPEGGSPPREASAADGAVPLPKELWVKRPSAAGAPDPPGGAR